MDAAPPQMAAALMGGKSVLPEKGWVSGLSESTGKIGKAF